MHSAFTKSDNQARARRRAVHSVFVFTAIFLALLAPRAWGQGAGYWHTSGSKILDSNGTEVRIAGINWYGFETSNYLPHGLWAQDYHTVLNTIKSLGYNVIRLPFSNQVVESNPVPTSYTTYAGNTPANQALYGATALQDMDTIIAYAGSIGLRVILDNHRSDAGNSNELSGLWYTSAYPQSNWIADWQTLATRYSSSAFTFNGNPTVIGMDLRNEPHLIANGSYTGACWTGDTETSGSYSGCPASNTAQNWPVAATAAGDAILAINPKLLIFVEGNDCYDGSCAWQGENLAGVATNPVVLNTSNQLVYSAHDYGPDLYAQPWFTSSTTAASLDAIWNKYWEYISAAGTAPVWLGEFGTDNTSTDIESSTAGSQGQWFEDLVAYLSANPTINWTYWALNGEDSFALLDSNYDATPVSSLKQSLLAGIQFPLSGGSTTPTFTLAPSATSLSVTQGKSATDTITVTDVNGFSGSVTLAASGLPSGITAAFGTNPTTGSSVLTLTASSSTTIGAASVTITGTSGSTTATTTISLAVSGSGFTLSPSASSVTVVQGKTATDTITVTDFGGFSGSVTLAASGLPSGVTAAFGTNPTTGSSVLTLTASSTATTGASTVTITGTSGSTTVQTTFSLTVSAAPGFTLTPSAASLTIPQGASATDTITVTDLGSFTGSVTLAASGLPSGVTAAFATNPTTSTSVLTLTASSTAASGTTTVTITGSSGSLTATTIVTLVVGGCDTAGMSIAPSKPTLSVARGSSATDTITVTEFCSSSSATLTVSGLPSGVTAAFGTNPTTSTSVLTLTASSTATTGTSTVSVVGTAGSLSSTTTISLTVSGSGFTLAPSASTLSVTQGKTATDTITVTDAGGFTGSVTLTASNLPSGVTVAYGTNPTTSTSVLTFTASASATVGTSTVTITGTSGSTTATTTIALTVVPSGGSACTVDYTISPQNTSAFGASLTLLNTGSTAWTSWTLTWTFANGQTVSSLWNGIETQSGASVTVKNESYNGSIAAGGTLTGIGFNGTWNGTTNAIPTAFSINGTACTVN